MKLTLILPLLILCSTAMADSEIYKWIDEKGVVSFSDDPTRIPPRFRSKALRGEYNAIRNPSIQQKPRVQKKVERKRALKAPRIATTPGSVQTKPAPPVIKQQPIKGHLGGDQIDPTPPSMKQPVPAPLGDQPTPTPLGMKQPVPAPLGDQPTPTPPGMKQPVPAPLGDQPTPTPAGMEQPVPVR